MTPERLKTVDAVLARRQPDLTVLLEQIYKPHNFSAIIRSCDAVGIPSVHAVAHQRGVPEYTHISSGAHKWVEVETHKNVSTAFKELKANGFQIVVTHLSSQAVDFRSLDYCKPTALVFGTEKFGVSSEALIMADAEVIIPMLGMTPSLNVSVACAVLLYEVQRQRQQAGLYEQIRLNPEEAASLRFQWLHPALTKFCRKHKLKYPKLDENGDLLESIPH